MKKIIFSLCCFAILSLSSLAQQKTVKGVVYDAADKTPLLFANVWIEGTNEGTITNENGAFELNINSDTKTLKINFVGYKEKIHVLESAEHEILIYLEHWAQELSEAVVMPKAAIYYVKEAIKKHSSNVANKPFHTQAYFSASNILEQGDKSNIKKDEAVFQTYYPNYSDTSQVNQSQLILHNFSDNGVEVDLSMILNKKVERKLTKLNKKNEKRNEKNQEESEEQEDAGEVATGNGPDFVLSTFQNLIALPFFKEENLEQIDFTIGSPSYYDQRELITIHFKNEKPINLLSTYTGTMYLDRVNLAIVSIDYEEFNKIPALIRPLIKAKTGMNILSFENNVSIQNQSNKEFWYPKKLIYHSKVNLKKGKAFKEDQYLEVSNKHLFNIEKIEFKDVSPIEPDYHYDKSKSYKEQIHTVEGVDWEDVNVILN